MNARMTLKAGFDSVFDSNFLSVKSLIWKQYCQLNICKQALYLDNETTLLENILYCNGWNKKHVNNLTNITILKKYGYLSLCLYKFRNMLENVNYPEPLIPKSNSTVTKYYISIIDLCNWSSF